MLTLDDLDHFNNSGMAHLFAAGGRRADPDTMVRLARIVACLNFCRDIPDNELVAGGLYAARRTARTLRRGRQRNRRFDASELLLTLESMQAALGEPAANREECQEAALARYAVEAEIQNAAAKLAGKATGDVPLLAALAEGAFEILPSSNLAPLVQVTGKFSGTAAIEVDLIVDGDSAAATVCVHLAIAAGFWRWTAEDGCCMSRNGDPAVFLAPDDGIVQALLAGLALRSGRIIAGWLEAIAASQPRAEAQSA